MNLEVKDKLLLNGAKYSGNMENNMPHGYGVYETNNIKYVGYFNNGVFDLFGSLTDKVIKYTYTGEFRNGMKNGYGKYFGHALGQGVGIEVHEEPRVSRLGKTVLEENMVITIEPGIYIPNLGGVRIEDMIVIKNNTSKVLTRSTKEIIVI